MDLLTGGVRQAEEYQDADRGRILLNYPAHCFTRTAKVSAMIGSLQLIISPGQRILYSQAPEEEELAVRGLRSQFGQASSVVPHQTDSKFFVSPFLLSFIKKQS